MSRTHRAALGTMSMDEPLRPQPACSVPLTSGKAYGGRTIRGSRSHPLVSSLASGLQATYVAETEDEVTKLFAGLIARLDHDALGTP